MRRRPSWQSFGDDELERVGERGGAQLAGTVGR